MIMQPKKTKEICICVDLRSLNASCVHDPFLTSFMEEVLENFGGQEAYSFTDGFVGYHQVRITDEDQDKTTFVTKWGSFSYIVMPFGLKHSLPVFSWIVFSAFKEFIQTILEVYLEDWMVFILLKEHMPSL
jgi:hypothetical protein